ncbi:hypothetical protein LOTGIDRAFT_228373 [Lottia gigantea]|uniref:WD repeat-containing protein 76 n=1 Tax=Lottia gigantea TaxID=225164 RepID=V4A1W1_LOTGI|nr:hypothetical protein LOTGIDRAFT_228373 [Lottia gigantea]ESO97818.1 hypothetical protein LOTGIDRAFT_228373 [Lottia gigantea]
MKSAVRSSKRKRESVEMDKTKSKTKRFKDEVIEDLELPAVSKSIEFDPSPRKDEIQVKNENIKPDSLDEDSNDEEEDEDYELVRQRNIEANNKFLSQIGMFEAKQQLSSAVKPKKESSQRGIKKPKKIREPIVIRKSRRLARIDPEGNHLPDPVVLEYNKPIMPPVCPVDMSAILLNDDDQDYHKKVSSIFTSTKIPEQKPLSSALQSYLKEINNLKLEETGIAKVVPTRVFSLAIHPMVDKLLIAAGGKWGGVGLWDVDSTDNQDGVVAYKPYVSPVNWVSFHQDYPAHIYTTSYDGSCRYADFETGKFLEIYAVPSDENILLRNADFLTSETLLISQSDGCVALVDRRTPSTTAENIYEVHERPLRTLNIHPDKQYFCTASLDATVKVWDIRQMKVKKNTCISEGKHSRVVNSANFSPITGKHCVSLSDDNTIHIYDVDANKQLKLKKSIRHNNHTGRWLTKLRCIWHPRREDLFISGSMERPRRIEMFSDEGTLVKTFSNEDYLGSVCSINAFHPSLNILAGANSSGRVHVFR